MALGPPHLVGQREQQRPMRLTVDAERALHAQDSPNPQTLCTGPLVRDLTPISEDWQPPTLVSRVISGQSSRL